MHIILTHRVVWIQPTTQQPTTHCLRLNLLFRLDVVVSDMETKIVSKFRELNVREEEYVLLKLILLFTSSELV